MDYYNTIKSTSADKKHLFSIQEVGLASGCTAEECIWQSYHENKVDTLSYALNGDAGRTILTRAKKCPFFIHPVFRQDGFFTLLSQFQPPSYFLLAYLEDYKTNPVSAQPLLTFSIYDDLINSHDVALGRGEVINAKCVTMDEGKTIMNNLLNVYNMDNEFEHVKTFNLRSDSFDVEDFISIQKNKWITSRNSEL